MKSFWIIPIVVLLQLAVGCASHEQDRFPSSEDISTEEYYRRNPRFRR